MCVVLYILGHSAFYPIKLVAHLRQFKVVALQVFSNSFEQFLANCSASILCCILGRVC